MKKKKKTKTTGQLRKHLWMLTSRYVRLSAADDDGYASCVTCGLTRHWKELQAGHFVPRAQGNATAWDLRNVHPQCYRCNINLGGNGCEYSPWMIEKYGQSTVDELLANSKTTLKITKADYLERIDDMASRLAKLADKARQFP